MGSFAKIAPLCILGLSALTACHRSSGLAPPPVGQTFACGTTAPAAAPADGPLLGTQTRIFLSDSGVAAPGAPLPVVPAQLPSEAGLVSPLGLSGPGSACVAASGLLATNIHIPLASTIRSLELDWNGTKLPAFDPVRSEVAITPHSYGEQLSFFQPLVSVAGLAPGSGTLTARGYDAAGAQVAAAQLTNLQVRAAAAPLSECAVPEAHPRIWLTPARLQKIRARDPATDPAAVRFLSHTDGVGYFLDALASHPDVLSADFSAAVYDPESYIPALALCYQLARGSDDVRASRCGSAAKTLATHIAQDYYTGARTFGRDDGYDIRFGLMQMMVAYDWLHDLLSAQERGLYVEVANRWTDWYANNGYARTLPAENYYAGWLQGLALTAVATARENPQAATLFSRLDQRLRWEVPTLNQRLCGGDWPEGWNYGPLSVQEFALVRTLLRDLGADPAPAFDFLEATPRWLTFQMAPDLSQLVSFGGYSGNLPHKTSPALLAILSSTTAEGALAGKLYRDGLAAPINDFSDGTRGFTAFEMIFADGSAQPSLASLPRSWLAPGTGRFISKSALGDAAAYQVTAETTSSFHDHYGYSNGDVRLYRGGTCLLCPSAYRGDSFQGEATTPAFSTYLVNGQEQGATDWNNAVLWTQEAGSFSAVALQLDSSYLAGRYEEGIVDPNNPLDYLVREVVHLRPGTLIVRDLHRRRHPTDTLLARWHLGSTSAPASPGPGSYRFDQLNVQFFGTLGSFQLSPDVDGAKAAIGTLLLQTLPTSTAEQEVLAVFSEQLQAVSYAAGTLKLSNGQCVHFGGGSVSVAACP